MFNRRATYPRCLFVLAASAWLTAGCTRQHVTYKGLKLTRPVVAKVTEGDVTRFLDQLRNQAAKAMPLPADSAAAKGNRATVDFVGTLGGTPFMGGTASGYALVLGAGQMIPGFEEGVVGMRVGQMKDVKVAFPADYQEPTLAGKTAVFRITLRGIEGLSRPPLTDEFAAQVSRGQLTTVEQLRKALREELARQHQTQAEQSIRAQVAEALLTQWRGEPGRREINRELDRIVQQTLQSAAQRGSGPAQGGPDAEAIRTSNRPGVVRSVKLSKVLAWIAKKEHIAVTDAEVEQAASQMARQQGQEPAAFLEMVRQQKAFDLLRRRILEDRVMALVMQNAQIEEPKRLTPRIQ
ncbi:MAG: trigger factor [Candidatus Coatesbacteria bacterium]